jgi:hypothetical protein
MILKTPFGLSLSKPMPFDTLRANGFKVIPANSIAAQLRPAAP